MSERAQVDEQAAATIAGLEARCAQVVDRDIAPLAAAARGELAEAALSLSRASRPVVVIATGFFIPSANPPACETDGPLGTAHLAAGLARARTPVRVLTDAACAPVVDSALRAVGDEVHLDVVEAAEDVGRVRALYGELGVTHLIAVERPGRAADGEVYDMRGERISAHVEGFEPLFEGAPWTTVGIGDGGNEIGMGRLEPALIAKAIPNGERIACRTPTDHLVVAGTSNWGAVALLGAVAVLRPAWRPGLMGTLEPELDRAALTAMIERGGAVDGVLRRPALSVDGLAWEPYWDVCAELAALARPT